MADKFLVVIGCQESKLNLIDKKDKKKLLGFIQAHHHEYQGVITVIRSKVNGDRNFQKQGDTIAVTSPEYLPYQSDTIISTPGYDIDTKEFRRDAEYYVCGISTGASVLCCAMSMYSCGLDVKVIENYCFDRNGDKLHKAACLIMNTYMPNCLIEV